VLSDPYVYKGTNVLINKFNERSQEVLDKLEGDNVFSRIAELRMGHSIDGNYNFAHFCKFHEFLFQDVYEWAGKPRSVDLWKWEEVLGGNSVAYSKPESIKSEGTNILQKMRKENWLECNLEKRAELFSKYMSDLWRVHGFREGNTRTTVLFCCDFARSRGMPIDQELLANSSAYVRKAMAAYHYINQEGEDISRPDYLHKIIKDGMERGFKKERENNNYIERVVKDINNSGFKATDRIVNDMKDLHYMMKREMSVREISQLIKKGCEDKDIYELAKAIGKQFAAQEKQQLQMPEPEQ
jgi:cell filamentation protein